MSAVIIAFNEAGRIADCVHTLAFADEILLVDSGSTDGTAEIAARLGVRVVQQAWLGFGPQKQFAVEQAAHDWVLCLDADERVSPELERSIQQALTAPQANAYQMCRCNLFLGRWLRHGEGYPDWSLRLFDRTQARWSDDPVHEKVVHSGAVASLDGDLMHHSADNLSRYLEKQNRYTKLQAEQMVLRGKRFSPVQMLLSPMTRFVKFYIVRRGFLDGLPGLIHILIGCMNSFFKYAKLYEIARGPLRKSREPANASDPNKPG